MNEKTQKKINNFIDSIYWVYILTGSFLSGYALKDVKPTAFMEYVACILFAIINAVLWLPLKLADLFTK